MHIIYAYAYCEPRKDNSFLLSCIFFYKHLSVMHIIYAYAYCVPRTVTCCEPHVDDFFLTCIFFF